MYLKRRVCPCKHIAIAGVCGKVLVFTLQTYKWNVLWYLLARPCTNLSTNVDAKTTMIETNTVQHSEQTTHHEDTDTGQPSST
jgi:hypothetical protein